MTRAEPAGRIPLPKSTDPSVSPVTKISSSALIATARAVARPPNEGSEVAWKSCDQSRSPVGAYFKATKLFETLSTLFARRFTTATGLPALSSASRALMM
ncbi:hypothetical protein BE20_15295 [Sorangium cellulosum]|nr:hypothetical protein BE20_15295 [Sorangium cellulosum]